MAAGDHTARGAFRDLASAAEQADEALAEVGEEAAVSNCVLSILVRSSDVLPQTGPLTDMFADMFAVEQTDDAWEVLSVDEIPPLRWEHCRDYFTRFIDAHGMGRWGSWSTEQVGKALTPLQPVLETLSTAQWYSIGLETYSRDGRRLWDISYEVYGCVTGDGRAILSLGYSD
jgi:hypothetical protein